MSENNKKWYVLRAAGGKEKKAKEYLEKEIERCGLQDYVSQVLVPTEKVYRIKDGKRVAQERLFYPGYVLIEAELTGELQYIIRNEVPHMSGFLTEKRDVSKGNGKALLGYMAGIAAGVVGCGVGCVVEQMIFPPQYSRPVRELLSEEANWPEVIGKSNPSHWF